MRPFRPRRRSVVLFAAGAVLVGGYAAAALVGTDRVPRGTTVAGVAIGGLDRTAAEQRLAAELGDRAAAPMTVVAGGTERTVEPAAAGLAVDHAATVTASGLGRSADPRHVWRVLSGGGAVDPVLTIDPVASERTTAALAKAYDRPARDAGLRIAAGKATTTAARDGVALRADEVADALQAGFLGAAPVALPAELTPAEITDAEVAALRAERVDPALSGPITVRTEAGSFRLTPTMIGKGLVLGAEAGAPIAALDAEALRKAAGSALDEIETAKPKNATVMIEDGKPSVVPAVNGTTVAAKDLAAAVEPALTKTGDQRRIEVPLSGAAAERSTDDAKALGITEVTGEFTTYFPYATYRNVNIGRAAELIDGTLLEPGDTFSLNQIVGERTKANGFTEGNIITGGKFRLELGGGVSQSATTTYNAMFFAGLKDVQHQPHTLYIDRYPAGREATVAWPNLDLKFTNDTEYGVLVQASVAKATPSRRGSITVKMWSTKTWDKITSTELRRSGFTTGRDLTDDDPKCQPMEPVQGFDVNYSRQFWRDGEVAKTEDFSWRYAPTDRVRCTS